MQRGFERTAAFFSSMQWAVYCWNREETQTREKDIPKKAHWVKALVSAIPTDERSIVATPASLVNSQLQLVKISWKCDGRHD